MRFAGGIGWVMLLGLAACAGANGSKGSLAPSRPDKDYPAAFVQADAAAGVGFSPLNRFRDTPSLDAAVEMARRQLAWSVRVRVRGERLFQRTELGQLEYRGEDISFVEVAEVPDDAVRLDTLKVGGHHWVFARAGDSTPKGGATFAAAMPVWLSAPPQKVGWLYAGGTAPVSYRDEPGSWDLATYRALVDLAFAVQVRTSRLERSFDGVMVEVTAQNIDTVLQGARVIGRWRDGKNAHVMVGVPAGGAVSLLEP